MEQKINLSNNQYITYRYFDNNSQKDYEILYLHGFYGDMDGRKGTVLENIAKEHNVNLIKLNYLGHGTSSGKVVDFVLSDWFENIKTVINKLSTKKLVLVGSSMGGWLSYLTALEYGEKIKAIITFSTAIDFLTEVIEPLMKDSPSYEIINSDGTPSGNLVTRRLLLDSKQYNLFGKEEIKLNCPIRMMHGLKDTLIPYQTAFNFFKKLTSKDAQFIITKEMDHRLSLDGNLDLLKEVIDSVLVKF